MTIIEKKGGHRYHLGPKNPIPPWDRAQRPEGGIMSVKPFAKTIELLESQYVDDSSIAVVLNDGSDFHLDLFFLDDRGRKKARRYCARINRAAAQWADERNQKP